MSLVENGRKLQIINPTAITNKLIPGEVYLLEFNPNQNCYQLAIKEKFELPKKIYGDHSIVNRWIKSWNDSTKNLGILLSGVKGTGKTITAELFCIKSNLPVILIASSIEHPEEFKDFITSPEVQESIVFIDEFEKIFSSSEDQEFFLSLMDGIHTTRLVFLLTVNSNNLSEYMYNRLGRIKYHSGYVYLEDAQIDEIIDDLLVEKSHRGSIHEFFDIVGGATMDLLYHLITDMNNFKEDALICGKYLNLRREPTKYDILETVYGISAEYKYQNLEINKRNLKDGLEFERECFGTSPILGMYKEFTENTKNSPESIEYYKKFTKDNYYNPTYAESQLKLLESSKTSMLFMINNNPEHTIFIKKTFSSNSIF